MVTPTQLIERANKWLEEKGVGPLSCHEIVYIVKKMMSVTDTSNSINDLEQNLALCTATAVCKLRGYKVPDIEGE